MKRTIAVALALCLSTGVQASPLTDFLIGGALLVNGGVWEMQRSSQMDKAETAASRAGTYAVSAIQKDEMGSYSRGAADWEFTLNGYTPAYNIFVSQSESYFAGARSDLEVAALAASDAEGYRDKAKVYKGVSLASFAIGSAFVVKAGVTYLVKKQRKKTPRFTENLDLLPAPDLSGGMVVWHANFGG